MRHLSLAIAALVLAPVLMSAWSAQEPPKVSPYLAPPDVAAPPADAEKTASGLACKVIKPGTETIHPKPADTVTVHYTGWTTDGKMFDSSWARQKPLVIALNRLIPGWVEGIQLMVVGEKRRLWIPEELAYKGQPGRPAGMLVFDVELLEVAPVPEMPAVPADVNSPPVDAERRPSGLFSRVIRPGTGTVHPKSSSNVTVHYTGWTTDGKMFDSSIMQGQPTSFRLDEVISGWTEGVQLMVEGEKRRFWIPQSLAYKGQPGPPAGMLVFDIDLISFK